MNMYYINLNTRTCLERGDRKELAAFSEDAKILVRNLQVLVTSVGNMRRCMHMRNIERVRCRRGLLFPPCLTPHSVIAYNSATVSRSSALMLVELTLGKSFPQQLLAQPSVRGSENLPHTSPCGLCFHGSESGE
jgi:hypothetical protein